MHNLEFTTDEVRAVFKGLTAMQQSVSSLRVYLGDKEAYEWPKDLLTAMKKLEPFTQGK